MAKQKGIVKLEGTIAGVTFYKTQDGYLAKEASSITAERIATDPAFQRTRENNAEFGRACKSANLLRTALRNQLLRVRDLRMYGRLCAQMMQVIKSDTTSARGLRNVVDGDITLLRDFDFNSNSRLASTLYAPYDISVDRATGKFTTSLDEFVPMQMIAAPSGSTHFRIVTVAAEIDFASGVFKVDNKATAILPLDEKPTALINLENVLTPDSVLPFFLAVGVEFLQQVNNEHYQLKNGGFNSLGLVRVETV